MSFGETQRQAPARTLLSDRPNVLLDEPTEHVGAVQAERILGLSRKRLCDRISISATYRPPEIEGGRRVVRYEVPARCTGVF